MRRGKKRKGIEAQRVKHSTPSRTIDALIVGEEQHGKQKKITKKKRIGAEGEIDAHMGEEEKNRKEGKNKRKKQGSGPQPSYLDSVTSYDLHGSYGGPILKLPGHRGNMVELFFLIT